MPHMYRKPDGNYAKQCAGCGTVYNTQIQDEDKAHYALRKFFSPRKSTRDSLESSCFRCRAIAEMRIRFGIDVEALIIEQGGVCIICETEIKFNTGDNSVSACVDHDHDTGETRGILCRHCNLGLGHFKDNIELLTKAINYLNAWKTERKGTDMTIKRDA